MKSRTAILFVVLTAAVVLLFLVDLACGSVSLPIRDVAAALTGGECPEPTLRIVVDIRLVKSIMAVIAGIALTISGLQMQTVFRNPLAGPYVLGISSGASLAVAIYILSASALGVGLSSAGTLGMAGAAWIGAALILAIVTAVGRRIKDIMVILILGIMISSGISSIVQILQYLSSDEALKSFVIWTMGSLGSVTMSQLPIVGGAAFVGIALAVATAKPLNILLLGEEYASSMGLDLRRSRLLIFASTALLAGTVTAFCGPIGFIGLALPHVARAIFATADHRILLPASALVGAAAMLGCDIISKSFTLPVNAITALTGIPVVIWIVIRNRSIAQ